MAALDSAAVQALAARLGPHFTLGVASAAFQIEGALSAGGRGPSGWDAFAAKPGSIRGGHSPAVACDHYHRAPEDVELMRALGVDSYRFSLSWPRIQPDGTGPFNAAGLDFYDRLIDRLLEAGISPMATLYHWDTPLPLEDRGGWLNRSTAERFAAYTAAAARRFGDRVAHWVTLNEPVSVTLNGYALGVHAPGHNLLFNALPAVHHQLLGHGMAVQALRAEAVTGAVGVTNLHSPVRPASGSVPDRLLARVFDLMLNRIYADPILLGHYPKPPLVARPWFRSLGRISDADLATIHQPLDFYGLNYYYPTKVGAGRGPAGYPAGRPEAMLKVPFYLAGFPEYDLTGFGWPVAPEHLGVLLRELKDRYADSLPPLYITESGASFPEPDHVTGPVPDAARIAYLASHLGSALAATAPGGIAEDVVLLGYYVWTLMDNFEWAAGYSQRFGLVHVDFTTLERTPKDSYYWLQALVRARRA
ncbi:MULTISPECIES: GH1 family beta-glucosidase [Arthrobacter]|uniref:Beta-glucosidase n=1 Tax=Arthrobacter oryzae TaxID=409290 RepID=A0A3N0BK91_9MICC|nr:MULTISPECIES: GH1 family beta-glucosidase [Arthrobacter]QYF89473.1 beta-glucosidase [Arthrobacter sp. PAMC25284]RNL48834.1 beta-glucosidase [Arthrobacter oryzae]